MSHHFANMQVTHHHSFDSLSTEKSTWNRLAQDIPFRTWEWLEAWWRYYGLGDEGRLIGERNLLLLAVRDEHNQLVGIAPWYQEITRTGTRVVKFLGDGEVCSEYADVLCQRGAETKVAKALAEWLTVTNESSRAKAADTWDRLELLPIDESDSTISFLLNELKQHGNHVICDNAPRCWRIALPETWDEYLKKCSKQLRNRLRGADRTWMQSGRVKFNSAPHDGDVDTAFDVLVDLHQRRWQSRGLPGCFTSRAFAAFHREVWEKFATEGRAMIHWLELDGQPLAVDYVLTGAKTMYGYQSGINPDQLSILPGHLMNMVALKNAIENGFSAYDFLRGDEPYKAHLRAEPRPVLAAYVIPKNTRARLRYAAWNTGRQMRGWAKWGLQTARELRGAGKQERKNEKVKG